MSTNKNVLPPSSLADLFERMNEDDLRGAKAEHAKNLREVLRRETITVGAVLAAQPGILKQ